MPSVLRELSRDEWCRTRKRGHLSAVFQPGEMLRCPLTRVKANGEAKVCGGELGRAPMAVREAVVRGPIGLPPIQNSELQRRMCRACCKTLDVFLVRRAERLEATG